MNPQNGLSCYSANLAMYLLPHRSDALDVVARSVRLAVRPGEEPAFSHHSVPLHQLRPGGELGYAAAGTGADAIEALAGEVNRNGQVLVLTGRAVLPWSVPEPGHGAPHLLLVDSHSGSRWHVVDEFSALRPAGRQDPYTGWITDEELLKAMEPNPAPAAEHKLRNEHAFGFPVPLPPDGTYQWLAFQPSRTTGSDLPDEWLTGIDEVFEALTEFWSGLDGNPDRRRFLEDMWACSQHHTYRYNWLVTSQDADPEAFTDAIAAWQNLPMALRFAADSADRGRARPSMVRTTFDQLRAADGPARELLPEYGYPGTH
ncbi:MAG: hypothetical protein ABW215_19745 [Kibdelosporangium sp.]